MPNMKVRSVVLGLVAVVLLAAWGQAEAQLRPASAEIVRAVGRVETLAKGQTTWAPAAVGGRLVEGDQIRALAGGSADLNLPDGSTILVAENTRFAVSKLEYDTQTRDRNASFHLAAGKVKAQVSQAAVQLVRARQSNFTISTPSGVAAVRGTITVVAFNDQTGETVVFAFPSGGESPIAARVSYTTRSGQSVVVTGNNFVRQVGNNPPSAQQSINTLPPGVRAIIQAAVNAATANSQTLVALNLVIPTAEQDVQLANPTVLNTTQTIGDQGGTSNTNTNNQIGREIGTPPPPPPPPPICASPPCEQ
jgi:hypothetical protein